VVLLPIIGVQVSGAPLAEHEHVGRRVPGVAAERLADLIAHSGLNP
jgi:hypothetical protein